MKNKVNSHGSEDTTRMFNFHLVTQLSTHPENIAAKSLLYLLQKAEVVDKNRSVPIALIGQIKLIRYVHKYTPITLDDIELPVSNILFNLRKNKSKI